MLPALPWSLQQRLWWLRQPRITERELRSGPLVTARLVPSGFEQGDCAYNAIARAGDGALYFAIGTHRPGLDARLLRLAPGADAAKICAALSEPSPSPAVAHGKVHVTPFEWNGALYFATHVGVYRRDRGIERPATPAGFRPYPGGRVVGFDLDTGEIRDVARAPGGEGIIAMQVDRDRGRAYAVTWPGGRLLAVDLASGTLNDHGPAFGEGERGGAWEQVGRDLAVEPESGRVYWCRTNGEIGWLDPDGRRGVAPAAIHDDRGPSSWRRIAWHPGRRAFVGLTTRGSTLFWFDPIAQRIEHLATVRSMRRVRPFDRQPPATLAFDLDAASDQIRYLALGPGLAGRRTRHTVEALTVSLRDRSVHHHGALRLDDGRYVTFAQGLSASGDTWHALAWIELPASSPDVQRLRAWHHERARHEIHRLPEQVGLIRFDLTGRPPA